jgi:transposase
MLTVEDYGRIRRAYRDGMSIRAIARQYHHSRRKVREALQHATPKGYTRRKGPAAPKLDPVKPVMEAILESDKTAPRKQRHTAAQIYRRLLSEHGYAGSYDQVRRYVKRHREDQRETFIPLNPQPGERLEADFGHISVDFPDGRRQVPVVLLTWGYSNRPFALATETERVEAILQGMVEGFEFFDCIPREVWWDNPKTVATKILRGRKREIHPRYNALASHYVFEPLFCMPRRGQEKGRVENRVYDLQRRWCTPVPRVRDLAELNAHLRRCCLAECERTVRGQSESIGVRFAREKGAALSLPAHRFDPCVLRTAQADKYQTVAFDRSRYSIPRRYAFKPVTIKAYAQEIVIVAADKMIARHKRSYEAGEQILDPLHYLVTLERRPAALDHADLYRTWDLPPIFGQMREVLESRYGSTAGARQYVRILQLLAHHPKDRVASACEICLRRGESHARAVIWETERLERSRGYVQAEFPFSLRADPVQVPRPDLRFYDQLIAQGEHAHEHSQQHVLAPQSQS